MVCYFNEKLRFLKNIFYFLNFVFIIILLFSVLWFEIDINMYIYKWLYFYLVDFNYLI